MGCFGKSVHAQKDTSRGVSLASNPCGSICNTLSRNEREAYTEMPKEACEVEQLILLTCSGTGSLHFGLSPPHKTATTTVSRSQGEIYNAEPKQRKEVVASKFEGLPKAGQGSNEKVCHHNGMQAGDFRFLQFVLILPLAVFGKQAKGQQ